METANWKCINLAAMLLGCIAVGGGCAGVSEQPDLHITSDALRVWGSEVVSLEEGKIEETKTEPATSEGPRVIGKLNERWSAGSEGTDGHLGSLKIAIEPDVALETLLLVLNSAHQRGVDAVFVHIGESRPVRISNFDDERPEFGSDAHLALSIDINEHSIRTSYRSRRPRSEGKPDPFREIATTINPTMIKRSREGDTSDELRTTLIDEVARSYGWRRIHRAATEVRRAHRDYDVPVADAIIVRLPEWFPVGFLARSLRATCQGSAEPEQDAAWTLPGGPGCDFLSHRVVLRGALR